LLFRCLDIAASEQAQQTEAERRKIDEFIAVANSVELRKLSPKIFQLAERLLKEGRENEARRYFEKGLEANPWALEHQLTLGEILARGGQPNALRERAEMVLRLGEDDTVLARASRLIEHPLPEAPTPFANLKEDDQVLVLVPVGEVSLFSLHDLGQELSKRLGMKVRIASVPLNLPPANRTAKARWIAQAREQFLASLDGKPEAEVWLGKEGFTLQQLKTDDEVFVSLMRKITESGQGRAALESLDAMLAKLESTTQFDAARIVASLRASVGERAGAKMLVLGVTSLDLSGDTSNFLFGLAATGKHVGVISLARFTAAFNGESPKRTRLVERLTKQSLSTIGFMAGVPRCTTPECARAYPESLAEHDQKPLKLCTACKQGLESVLGHQLPSN
jgi:predicted Zn-dependent protease